MVRRALPSSNPVDFQSPPHRGIFCDFSDDGLRRAFRLLSVPSSSGNLLRRLTGGSRPPEIVAFQSPPHRGIFCDIIPGKRSRSSALCLSVPSSSGNLLRLVRAIEPIAKRQVFLSVPSSSGNLLRLCEPCRRFLEAELAFSPLLIGESSATKKDKMILLL